MSVFPFKLYAGSDTEIYGSVGAVSALKRFRSSGSVCIRSPAGTFKEVWRVKLILLGFGSRISAPYIGRSVLSTIRCPIAGIAIKKLFMWMISTHALLKSIGLENTAVSRSVDSQNWKEYCKKDYNGNEIAAPEAFPMFFEDAGFVLSPSSLFRGSYIFLMYNLAPLITPRDVPIMFRSQS